MINTERLSIRRITEDDWKAVQAIWTDQSNAWCGQYDKPHDLQDDAVRTRIARWSTFRESKQHMFFAVCLQEKVIGYVAFNRTDQGYEIGYNFHSAFHGRGYAGESIRALLEQIRTEGSAKVITAGTALNNLPSMALLASLGFVMTGTERVSFYKDMDGKDIFFEGGIFELRL